MAKFGGFPGGGGMGNMQNILKQAQKMQKEMEEKQAEVAKKEIETSAGGGAVVVRATGNKEIRERLIENGSRTTLEKFDARRVSKECEELYERIVR